MSQKLPTDQPNFSCPMFYNVANVLQNGRAAHCYEFGAADIDTETSLENHGSDFLSLMNSPYYVETRTKQKGGGFSQLPTPCKSCVGTEDADHRSPRQNYSDEMPEEFAASVRTMNAETHRLTRYPTRLALNYEPFCNLRCMTCSVVDPFSSVTKAGFDTVGVEFDNLLTELNFSRVNEIIFSGGEPLLSRHYKKLLKFVSDLPRAKDIDLIYHTNLSVLPTEEATSWGRFKRVTIIVGIDADPHSIEYVRYPLKWTTLENNLSALSGFIAKVPNLQIRFSYLLTILSLPHLGRALSALTAFRQLGNVVPSLRIISKPSHFRPQLLSASTIEAAIADYRRSYESLRNLLESEQSPVTREVNESFERSLSTLTEIESHKDEAEHFKLGLTLHKLDHHRGTNYFSTFPHLTELGHHRA